MPVAVKARLERGTGTARLSFDLSHPVTATARLLEDPDRIILDLPRVNFQLDPAVGRLMPQAGGLVRGFRFGLFDADRSRVVIALDGPATITGIATAPIASGDPSRLTVSLARTDRLSFHEAARSTEGSSAPRTAAANDLSAVPKPVIVIDPGHGGIDPGARGLGGVVEKTITFDFAAALADQINASGRYMALLTRKDDSFVSLGDRVKRARESNAALFVSVHADTLAAAPGVTGATVYTCSDRASDAEAARVAASENEADAVGGIESAPDKEGVNDILFDLTRRETRTYAHQFQRTLVGYWEKIARLNKNPERAAGFKVLQAPDVPSVLLELGYLSSDKDMAQLTSPDWRAKAAGSVLAAIDSFFAPRRPGAASPAMASAPAAAALTAHD